MQLITLDSLPEKTNGDFEMAFEEWLRLDKRFVTFETTENLVSSEEKAYSAYVKDCMQAEEPPLSYNDFLGIEKVKEKYISASLK